MFSSAKKSCIFGNVYEFQELEDLIKNYLARKSYYYNVVTWIDRCLYAIGKYHAYYKKKIAFPLSD